MLAVSRSPANPGGSLAEPRWNQAGSLPAVTALEAQLQNIPGEIRLCAPGSNGGNKCELPLSGS